MALLAHRGEGVAFQVKTEHADPRARNLLRFQRHTNPGGFMKLSIALILTSAVLVAGCSRPVVKETIVERPVPVVKETVVERPAATGASAPNCVYASQGYSHGSISCQDRTQYRCENGIWNRTFTAC
jgi:hypothetical protein